MQEAEKEISEEERKKEMERQVKEARTAKAKELQQVYTKEHLLRLYSDKNRELREMTLILKEAIETYPKQEA